MGIAPLVVTSTTKWFQGYWIDPEDIQTRRTDTDVSFFYVLFSGQNVGPYEVFLADTVNRLAIPNDLYIGRKGALGPIYESILPVELLDQILGHCRV